MLIPAIGVGETILPEEQVEGAPFPVEHQLACVNNKFTISFHFAMLIAKARAGAGK
jgi:hypothetical protein